MKKLLLVFSCKRLIVSLSRIGNVAPNVPKEKVQINENTYTQAIKKRQIQLEGLN